MTLKYVNAAKPKSSSTNQRREKFSKALGEQLLLLEKVGPNNAVKGSWTWFDNGSYFINPVYGRKPLQLAKSKNAIQCADLDGCRSAINQLLEMTQRGDLDQCLSDAASSIRSGFRKPPA